MMPCMIPFEALTAMRQIDTEDATDVKLVQHVCDSCSPRVYLTADDPIYTDGHNLYGRVIQYGSDGKPKLNLQRDRFRTKFTRIPIPKELSMSDTGMKYLPVMPITAQQLNGTHLGKVIRIDTPEGSSIQGPLTRVTTYKYDPPIQTVNGEKPLEQIEVELTIKPFGIITVPANSHTTINP